MNEYNLSSDGALGVNSSAGKLLKWKIGDRFIKTSTLDTTSMEIRFMYESYAEVIAYYIAKWIGIKSTKYTLCKVVINNEIETIACESLDFNKSGTQYISMGKLMMEQVIPIFNMGDINSYRGIVNVTKIIPGFKQYLDRIIILDYVIMNDDRHYGNFGVSKEPMGICKPAPIFDNGNSLFCHKHTEGITYSHNLDRHLICKPFSRSFDTQVRLVDSRPNIDIQLVTSKLGGLLNELVLTGGLPEQRAWFIQNLILDRLERLEALA